MKAVLQKQGFPTVLRISDKTVDSKVNKFLLYPWKKGEIVKVAPYEKQEPLQGKAGSVFGRNYVVIQRKIDGVWQRWVWCWRELEPLKK